MICALLVSSMASAADRNYFNGDKNYIQCGGSMGATFFIDRSTLKVEKYAPPIYIISVDTVSVYHYHEGGTKISRRLNQRFMYDYANRKMYIYAPNNTSNYKSHYEIEFKNRAMKIDTTINWNSDWAYINSLVYYGEGIQPPVVGELTFALAYKVKFYLGYENRLYDGVRGVVDELKDGI